MNKICPNCGVEVDKNAEFCEKCEFVFPKDKNDEGKCSNCGQEKSEGLAFCPNCGKDF
jgi:predicted amidophosphoribosyltransferase